MWLGFGRESSPGLAGGKTVVSVRGGASGTNTRLCSGDWSSRVCGAVKPLSREISCLDPSVRVHGVGCDCTPHTAASSRCKVSGFGFRAGFGSPVLERGRGREGGGVNTRSHAYVVFGEWQ